MLHPARASWNIITRSAVLRGYGALAGFTLAGDHGGIRRDDKGGHRFLRFLDLGRQTPRGTTPGTDALLVLLPKKAEEGYGPDGYYTSTGDDGRNYRSFGAVTVKDLAFLSLLAPYVEVHRTFSYGNRHG